MRWDETLNILQQQQRAAKAYQPSKEKNTGSHWKILSKCFLCSWDTALFISLNPQRMNPTDFDDPLTFPLTPPWGSLISFCYSILSFFSFQWDVMCWWSIGSPLNVVHTFRPSSRFWLVTQRHHQLNIPACSLICFMTKCTQISFCLCCTLYQVPVNKC